MLRKFHQLSYRRIAEEMRISEKTVEKHLAKALVLCRASLQRVETEKTEVVDLAAYRRERQRRGIDPERRSSSNR